jgi:hypothetical protein
MRTPEIPLLEHRFGDKAVLNPEDYISYREKAYKKKRPKIPRYGVFSFWPKMNDVVKKKYKAKENRFLGNMYPIQIFNHKDIKATFICLPFSAPASGAFLDLAFALGTEYAVMFGSCGVLTPSIERCEIIVPRKALRDEGTSYHFEKPTRFSHPSKLVLRHLDATLKANNIHYHKGWTWTTDAFFRETPRKVREYRKEGCISVEMEAAALFSIAKFRKKHIGAMIQADDCIGGERWDSRKIGTDLRTERARATRLLELSLEALHGIHDEL